jgi:hypothetical protein
VPSEATAFRILVRLVAVAVVIVVIALIVRALT